MNLTDLFFEFSHEGRFKLFKSLCFENKKHNQLQKELNIPGPEISRHLKRLCDKNLIKKGVDSQYEITNIGKIFFGIIDVFEIVVNHKEFFNTHDITSIPLTLMYQLGQLKEVESSDKTLENIELWSNLVKNSVEFIFAISNEMQNSLLPIIERKLEDHSMEIRALIDKNILKTYTIPEKLKETFKAPRAFYKKINLFENVRFLKEINFSLLVSDSGAILFLSKDGKIDYSQCLIDYHVPFLEWAKSLFEWYWNKSKRIKPYIDKELQAVNS